MIDAIYFQHIIKERSISLAQWVSGSGVLIGLRLLFLRVKYQEQQTDIQINKERKLTNETIKKQ